jgi:PhnB protein
MHVEPYLFFEGCCEEALEFYRRAIGAEIQSVQRFGDSPESSAAGHLPPGSENKVMHAMFRVGDTTVLASDGRSRGSSQFQGFALSITVADASEADRLFLGLSAGGTIVMPLTETFYSPRFGMVTDRFGVLWMIYLPRPGGKK